MALPPRRRARVPGAVGGLGASGWSCGPITSQAACGGFAEDAEEAPEVSLTAQGDARGEGGCLWKQVGVLVESRGEQVGSRALLRAACPHARAAVGVRLRLQTAVGSCAWGRAWSSGR